MVQYIFTPWRDRRELLAVRRQFYPTLDGETKAATAELETGQHAAVARVAMWMQRGHCPHMVESTALLMAAVLSDEGAGGPASSHARSPATVGSLAGSSVASSAYAARATYAAAFSRFVTGLLDGHQDRARKLSMHGLAQTVGLPPGFVELRHQATHEALPALRRLRVAARQALAWIWGYYWVNMEEVEPAEAATAAETAVTATEPTTAQTTSGDLRTALLKCVDNGSDDMTITVSLVETYGEAEVLAVLAAIGAEDEGRSLRCIRLSRKLLQKDGAGKGEAKAASTESTTKTRTRTKAKTAVTSQPTSPEAKAASTTETSTGPAPWTMGNLNLSAMRAAMAQSRQALYQGGEKKEEEVQEEEHGEAEEDVAMAEDAEVGETAAAPGPELASRNPRWTRYTGEWTPRPIGVV